MEKLKRENEELKSDLDTKKSKTILEKELEEKRHPKISLEQLQSKNDEREKEIKKLHIQLSQLHNDVLSGRLNDPVYIPTQRRKQGTNKEPADSVSNPTPVQKQCSPARVAQW